MQIYKKLLLLLLSISFTACIHLSSESTKRSISSIEKIPSVNELRLQPKVKDPLRQALDSQCIKEVCGPVEKNLGGADFAADQNLRYIYKPEFPSYKLVEDAMSEFGRLSYQAIGMNPKIYEGLLAEPGLILPPEWKEFLNRVTYLRWYETAATVKANGDYLIEEKSFDKLPISPADLSWAKKVFKLGKMKPPPYKKINILRGHELGLRVFLAMEYPNVPLAQSIKLAVTECHRMVERWKKVMKTGGFAVEYPICANNMSTGFRERDLGKELGSILYEERYFPENGDAIFLEREVPWHSDLAKFMATKSYQARVDVYNTSASDALQAYSWANKSCQDGIADAYEVSGSKFKIRRTEELLLKIKETTKKLIKFSHPQLQEDFNSQVDRTGFKFPASGAEIISTVLRRYKSLTLLRKQLMDPKTTSVQIQRYLAIYKVFLTSDEDPFFANPGDMFLLVAESIMNQCWLDSKPLSDAMVTEQGESVVSWVSVKYPELGFGIMAHEMGHRVSGILKNVSAQYQGKFYFGMPESLPIWERRACINMFHGQTKQRIDNENLTTEEDWADYYATEVMNAHRTEMPWLKNIACTFATEVDGKNGGSYKVNFQGKQNDSHSAGDFRILHVEQEWNHHLPKTCENTIGRLKDLPACFYEN